MKVCAIGRSFSDVSKTGAFEFYKASTGLEISYKLKDDMTGDDTARVEWVVRILVKNDPKSRQENSGR